MAKTIGIDLGTTYSHAALMKAVPQIVTNSEGERKTPSVVGWHRDAIIVGATAVSRGKLAPRDTINSIKRLMGRAFSDPNVQEAKHRYQYAIESPEDATPESLRVRLGGKAYSPAEISSFILKKMRDDIAFREKEVPTLAVVTVPAYFTEKQRVATYHAATLANLKVLRLLHEPLAAAIRYSSEIGGSEPKTLLVYDLGGGTFDVSIVVSAGASIPEIQLKGDMWLGGDDFDARLMDYIIGQVRRELAGADPKSDAGWMWAFREETRKIKEQLTNLTATDFFLTLPNNREALVEVTRATYEELVRDLVDRTIDITNRAINDASLQDKDIDYVIVAGGSSMMPLVQECLERRFGADRLVRSLHPKECVAEGAAILAARLGSAAECPKCAKENREDATVCLCCGENLQPFTTCSACNHRNPDYADTCMNCGRKIAISIAGIGQTAGHDYLLKLVGDTRSMLIAKETPCDSKRTAVFTTTIANQPVVKAAVYALEHAEDPFPDPPAKPDSSFFGILPKVPQGTRVTVTCRVDHNLMFHLTGALDDDIPVPFFKLQGEQDHLVESTCEEAEEVIRNLPLGMRVENQREIDEIREAVFRELMHGARVPGGSSSDEAQRHFARAKIEADRLKYFATVLTPSPNVLDRVMRLKSWIVGFWNEYSELIQPATKAQLLGLIHRIEKLEQSSSEDAAASLLPDMKAFNDRLADEDEMWWAVMCGINKLYYHAPERATYFDSMREQIISSHIANAPTRTMVNRLVDGLGAEMRQFEKPCPVPGCNYRVLAGDRKCGAGHDLWEFKADGNHGGNHAGSMAD